MNSSIRPAFTYSRIVAPPPAMRTSRSPAASRAWSSAVSMPSLTKWKVVLPGRSQGSRSSCVATKTGVWNGASSGHIRSPASNMRLPMTLAPVRSNVSRTTSLSRPSWPPPSVRFSRKNRVGNIHCCSSIHCCPNSSALDSGAMNPFRPVHHEVPLPADAELERPRGGAEPLRSPPPRQVPHLGERCEHQLPWGADDRHTSSRERLVNDRRTRWSQLREIALSEHFSTPPA